jgi:hypothetical protein
MDTDASDAEAERNFTFTTFWKGVEAGKTSLPT